mmetsp:Transcript_36302/g.108890  ORF Transcript_36302/g.108890 Transcript_36302/m.108890 type:complete len:448 (-) Transcript_36302:1741-3084(-)
MALAAREGCIGDDWRCVLASSASLWRSCRSAMCSRARRSSFPSSSSTWPIDDSAATLTRRGISGRLELLSSLDVSPRAPSFFFLRPCPSLPFSTVSKTASRWLGRNGASISSNSSSSSTMPELLVLLPELLVDRVDIVDAADPFEVAADDSRALLLLPPVPSLSAAPPELWTDLSRFELVPVLSKSGVSPPFSAMMPPPAVTRARSSTGIANGEENFISSLAVPSALFSIVSPSAAPPSVVESAEMSIALFSASSASSSLSTGGGGLIIPTPGNAPLSSSGKTGAVASASTSSRPTPTPKVWKAPLSSSATALDSTNPSSSTSSSPRGTLEASFAAATTGKPSSSGVGQLSRRLPPPRRKRVDFLRSSSFPPMLNAPPRRPEARDDDDGLSRLRFFLRDRLGLPSARASFSSSLTSRVSRPPPTPFSSTRASSLDPSSQPLSPSSLR